MPDIFCVVMSKGAEKDLKDIPKQCRDKLELWIISVTTKGVRAVRKLPGFHDEPLKGKRKGQRSVRLNNAYRAIYIIKEDKSIEFIEVKEVNNHDY